MSCAAMITDCGAPGLFRMNTFAADGAPTSATFLAGTSAAPQFPKLRSSLGISSSMLTSPATASVALFGAYQDS